MNKGVFVRGQVSLIVQTDDSNCYTREHQRCGPRRIPTCSAANVGWWRVKTSELRRCVLSATMFLSLVDVRRHLRCAIILWLSYPRFHSLRSLHLGFQRGTHLWCSLVWQLSPFSLAFGIMQASLLLHSLVRQFDEGRFYRSSLVIFHIYSSWTTSL